MYWKKEMVERAIIRIIIISEVGGQWKAFVLRVIGLNISVLIILSFFFLWGFGDKLPTILRTKKFTKNKSNRTVCKPNMCGHRIFRDEPARRLEWQQFTKLGRKSQHD
jgi:hypothetical protein